MGTELATKPETTNIDAATAEVALVQGDLGKMNPAQRLSYYRAVCRSLDLNELTQPFQYIILNNRMVLYATRACTEQLRTSRGVSVVSLDSHMDDKSGLYRVTASVRDAKGRTDASTGVVSVKGLQGDNLANALMKAETKAKRRATLSLCGLGWLDESEIETVQGAQSVSTAIAHSEAKIIENPKPKPKTLPAPPRTIADTIDDQPPQPADDVPPWDGPTEPDPSVLDNRPKLGIAMVKGLAIGDVFTTAGTAISARDGTSKRGSYCSVLIEDGTDKMWFKYWNQRPDWLVKGVVVEIDGKVDEFNGQPNYVAEHVRQCETAAAS